MRKDPDREYMYSHYHLDWGENWIRTPRYGFPLIAPTTCIPERMVPFDKIRKWRLDGACVGFNLADRRIDCAWTHPERYIDQFRKAACVATPDFSVLPGMERADVIHNISRSLRLGRRFQELGLEVMITAIWAKPDTYDICFEALPRNAVLLVSTVGSMNDEASRKILRDGLKALCERKPQRGFILYGKMPNLDFDIPVIRHFERCNPTVDGGYQPELQFNAAEGGR